MRQASFTLPFRIKHDGLALIAEQGKVTPSLLVKLIRILLEREKTPAASTGGNMEKSFGRAAAVAFLLVGGLLNGLTARLAQSWHEDGPEGAMQLFGISPFEIMVCCIAVSGLLRASTDIRSSAVGWVSVPFLAATLFPSSLGAWISLCCYASWVAWASRGEARNAAILFLGIGACAIWWALGERSFGDEFLLLDAWVTTGLLSLFMHGVQRVGNVIANGSGHRIVVLIGCSTAYGLPLSLLSMVALARWNGARTTGRLVQAAAVLALSYLAINILRLMFLAISPSAYHLGHGTNGLAAFDATATLLTVAIAWWAAQPDKDEPSHLQKDASDAP